MKRCEACGINAVRSSHSIRCETCHIALRKANQNLAAYRHRDRLKEGTARKNRSYRGGPTQSAINAAVKTLAEAGFLRIPVPDDDEDSLSTA